MNSSNCCLITIGGIISYAESIIDSVYNLIDDIGRDTISINIPENPKLVFAVMAELNEKNIPNSRKLVAFDAGQEIRYTMSNGKHYLQNVNRIGEIRVLIDSNEIIISTRYGGKNAVKNLQRFLHTLYTHYNSPSIVKTIYMIGKENWGIPIFRRTRDIENIKTTTEMKSVIEDVELFMKSEKKYIASGHPYRKGYFLYGGTGTGKTTLIEIISQKHNMDIYMIDLNSDNMTDAKLSRLISKVPEKSIIVIEEIDKQIKTMNDQTNNKISIGGILSSIDGPSRMSNQSIIILTSNQEIFLSEANMEALLRKGRIDSKYHMITQICKEE